MRHHLRLAALLATIFLCVSAAFATTTLTGTATWSSTSVGVVSGQLARAVDINSAIQTLLNNTVYLYGRDYDAPVVRASGVTAATGYELATVPGGSRVLRLARDVTFARLDRAMVPATTPEYGWTKRRPDGLTSGDQGVTTADTLTLAASALNYNSTTGYFQYKKYSTSRMAHVFTARISSNGDAGSEAFGLRVSQDTDDTAGKAFVGVGWSAGAPALVNEISGGAASTIVITADQRDNGVWVRIGVDPYGNMWIHYSLTNSASRPAEADWVYLYKLVSAIPAPVFVRAGFALAPQNADGNLVGEVLYYDDQFATSYDPETIVNPTWGAQGYDATTPAQRLLTDWPVGTKGVSQAQARLVLADASNKQYGDAATVTYSLVCTSGTGTAAAGTYYAADALEFTCTSGYASLWVKMLSDGTQAGSVTLPVRFDSTL